MSTLLLAQDLTHITNAYALYTGIVNLSLGLIGNTLIIFIFATVKIFQGNQCAFYLTVEAISNNGLLLVIYIFRILNNILGYDITLVSLSYCKIRGILSQIFGFCSLITVCLLAMDQCLCTNHRHQWRQMSTLKLARRCTFCNVAFVVLHSSTIGIFTEIRSSLGCTIYQPPIKRYYSFFYYPILNSLLPLLITISFSLFAYRNVRRIISRRVPINRRRLDRQMTVMTLTRVVCLVVLGVPYIASSLVALNVNDSPANYLQLAVISLVISIFSSLLNTNFAVNNRAEAETCLSFANYQILKLLNYWKT